MNKTKKKGLLKVAGLMAAIMMLTTCVVAGTMAKYTSTGNTTAGNINVAKWDIDVNGTDFDASLGSLTWTIQAIESSSGATDAVTENMMAPGTWGYAPIKIENKGNVDATLKVTGFSAPSVGTEGVEFKLVVMTDTTAKDTYSEMVNVADGEKITTDGYKLAKGGSLTNAALDFKVGIGTDASKSYGSVEEYSSDTTRYNASKDIFSLTLEKSGEAGDQESIYVYYKWEFELPSGKDTNDKTDTGMIGESFTFGSLAITATQATKSA